MILLQLPNVYPSLYKNIQCLCFTDRPIATYSPSFSKSLASSKEQITIHSQQWDYMKRVTNPYEFIDTVLPNKKRAISNYKPLSRAYFKFIEIWNTFFIASYSLKPLQTFHLAEGPGSFIEAIVRLRRNPKDVYIGMTLLHDEHDHNIPTWKRAQYLLRENPNIKIEKGRDQTGNILSLANFVGCYEDYGGTMDFITADGGFDFSIDFNSQEISITSLLFAQIAYAVCLQKQGGNFVLKIFDSYMQHTIDLLFLLSSLYQECYVTKPLTSRFANSERYIVCKGFLMPNTRALYPHFLNAMITVCHMREDVYIHRFLSNPIPQYFTKRVEEVTAMCSQQQIESIQTTLALIQMKNRDEKIELLIQNHIAKCMAWCQRHGVAIGE